jgi:ribose/xylose/arabinose/galactoside ABC-type transport system permease subunit
VSTFTLGGVIALKLGDSAGLLVGIVAAAAAGALLGVIQGGLVSRLNISSVPITLAGFLMIWGIAEIVAGGEGEQVVSQNFERGEKLLKPVLTIFTISSLIVIGCVIVLHLVLAYTRLGRNLRAVGGDRRASRISGIRVPFVIIGTFAAAGVVAALGGALQAVSFSSVSPDVSFNPLLFAVIAAIIGGVGITGAHGSPLGIACGVLAFETLEETFVILKLDPNVATVLTGAFLLAIAIISAPDLRLPSKWRTTNLPAALSRRSKESALDPSGS